MERDVTSAINPMNAGPTSCPEYPSVVTADKAMEGGMFGKLPAAVKKNRNHIGCAQSDEYKAGNRGYGRWYQNGQQKSGTGQHCSV